MLSTVDTVSVTATCRPPHCDTLYAHVLSVRGACSGVEWSASGDFLKKSFTRVFP